MLENKKIVFKREKSKPKPKDIGSQIMSFRDSMGMVKIPTKIVLDAKAIKSLRRPDAI